MSPITTHVLDTAKGCPAEGIAVTLEYMESPKNWINIAAGSTNEDGRIMDWMQGDIQEGEYRISFDTNDYHDGAGFFPSVTINFRIEQSGGHYHVPLLLSPFSFSTYRGS